jgi:ABC-type Na+ efflux pump permease subunit
VNAQSVLGKSLWYGGILTLTIALVGAVVGFLVAGIHGLASALLAALITAVFLGLTAVSIMVAARVTRGRSSSTGYFAVILGVWVVKFVLFFAAMLVLRRQPWLDPSVFIVVLIIAVLGSLITDGLALQRARLPYVGDIELPGSPTSGSGPRD